MSIQDELDGFLIVIDSREQLPLFNKTKNVAIIYSKLDEGDYSCRGFEKEITIERKSASDFLGSISSGRERFMAELTRMKPYAHKFIVVESSLQDLSQPVEVKGKFKSSEGKLRPLCKQYVGMHPNAVFNTIIAIQVRYSIPFFFADNKATAEKFVYETLKKFYILKRKGEI